MRGREEEKEGIRRKREGLRGRDGKEDIRR